MAIKDRREREKEQRHNDILKAAEKLFLSRGYDDVSMNDIAQEVELSKATIYLYFDNKEELFFAIVLRGNLILNSMIQDEVKKAESGIDKVSAFRKAYHEFNRDYSDYIRIYKYFQSGRFDLDCIMDSDEIAKSSKDKMFKSPNVSDYLYKINKMRGERFSIMSDSVQIGIDDGTIRSDVNPSEAAVLLSSISKNMSDIPQDHEKLLERQGIDRDKFVMDVEDLIRHMIMNYQQE
ncbi:MULTISPECIES: TetR/AcrR family transcriptional regulator [Methanobacterium]|jgi:AcrR family transcriptional regulator|uniref:TetR family transcriptional regulator n=1 Tax=Methanobacterium subterraneum TaxID=59277 RepID=A0A2H4VBL7_9EURY|nr:MULTISPECIES: TetR/AcrR family transcriptional regulator [Methanobacterium]MBW4256092.1 TetR/AcrR family transcriptional regulator [Methanobacterium sp. YSL]PKL72895.1 MAG: TetR/AcrR family transcriptional regulator [Methanobacteriales archaeon HGW-Methanobacteriales-2]AUB55479.1 TetR family transcriptional regulator [Methanobacterium subterraneum]AUB57547.1 TetR family transcriptional regulator [Methanobacterium sp. MZ-A1]MCC7559537.1 TetR/AcrR family transcriptional regulator [Methanobact